MAKEGIYYLKKKLTSAHQWVSQSGQVVRR